MNLGPTTNVAAINGRMLLVVYIVETSKLAGGTRATPLGEAHRTVQ